MDFSFDDFEPKEELSVENTETSEIKDETQTEAPTEIEAKPEAESPTEEGLKADETGDNSGAESPTPEYTPNFKYNIKDEEKEFPEFLREVVKSKEQEDQLRDLFTKVDAFDGIKESRTKVETDFNTYKESVTNEIYPVLDTIAQFDKANAMKDFGKAWELSDVNPNEVIDYLMMDEKLSETIYQKVLEQVNAEPQALSAQRNAYQEQTRARSLEHENKSLNDRLNNMEANTYGQALEFSISQNADKAQSFDAANGEGSFRQFVQEFSAMKKQGGVNLQPHEAVSQAVNMLGLSNANSQGNIINTQEQTPQVAPQESKQPAALPNLGTGSNVSMVQKAASNYDDWEKQLLNG